MKTFWGLRHHRTVDVRDETRAALLAYGFLRGKKYRELEPNALSEPDWGRVFAIARKFGPGGPLDLALVNWREAGEKKPA